MATLQHLLMNSEPRHYNSAIQEQAWKFESRCRLRILELRNSQGVSR